MSRDDCQKSRRGRRWRCEPNEVIAEVRSEKGEVESCPQSTPSKGMVVVQVQEGLMVHHWFAHCATCPFERPGSFLGLPLQLQLTTAHNPLSVCTPHHLSFPKAQKLSVPSCMLHCSPFQKAQKLSTPSCVLCHFPF